MRTYKFRAWDNKKKEWLMGYGYGSLGGFNLCGESMLLGEWSQTIDRFLFSRGGYTPDDLKIMQFTGRIDRRGKEIFEGDVIAYNPFPERNKQDNFMPSSRRVVKWKESRQFTGFNIGGNTENWQVVGNVWENPELLKN